MNERRFYGRTNYLKQPGKRRKLVHYLKAGAFRKIAGKKFYGRRINRRRHVLAATALIIFLIGIYFVFF